VAKYRPLYTQIWSKPWFERLPSNRKLHYIYLFTNDHCNDLGLYPISRRRMTEELAMDFRTISRNLKYFEREKKIVYEDPSGLLWVKNYLKYQPIARNVRGICTELTRYLPRVSNPRATSDHIATILLQKYSGQEPYIREIIQTIERLTIKNDRKRSKMIANPNTNTNTNTNTNPNTKEKDQDIVKALIKKKGKAWTRQYLMDHGKDPRLMEE